MENIVKGDILWGNSGQPKFIENINGTETLYTGEVETIEGVPWPVHHKDKEMTIRDVEGRLWTYTSIDKAADNHHISEKQFASQKH